jgi:hypothetical protein
MEILRVIYKGFNVVDNLYADCILLIRRNGYSVKRVYEISVAERYRVCSEWYVDKLIKRLCEQEGGDFWAAYLQAVETGYSFNYFIIRSTGLQHRPIIPRFSEGDFGRIFQQLGGKKIKESTIQTPDFQFNNILLELKDLQKDSLRDIDRQENISKSFMSVTHSIINLDMEENYGAATEAYHRLVDNALRNHVKKASSQLKSYKIDNRAFRSGLIFLNTGMFSLPHQIFKSMLENILARHTKTIEFAFVFSQITQGNGFDNYATFYSEFVGNVPEEIKILKEKVDELVEAKMSAMIIDPVQGLTLAEQQPISFYKNGKIFYWNPGPVPDSRLA